ncbi:MAG: hypothetical protein V4735_01145 [Pseudomonadota bacterium]
MPWVMQMLGFALLLLGIGVALWISFWLLLVLFCVGLGMVIWTHVKSFLLAKGILNPTPGVRMQPPGEAEATLIEGDFQRVDEKQPENKAD